MVIAQQTPCIVLRQGKGIGCAMPAETSLTFRQLSSRINAYPDLVFFIVILISLNLCPVAGYCVSEFKYLL